MGLLGEIRDLFNVLDLPTQYIMIFTPCWFFVLLVFAIKVKRDKETVFNILAFVPVVNFIIFFLFNYTKGDIIISLDRYGYYGGTAIIYCILSIMYGRKKKKIWPVVLSGTASFAITLWALNYVIFYGTHFSNYSRMGYEASMTALIDELEQNYVLRDYKEIDFDGLREKYIPMAAEAEKTGDREAFSMAIANLCYEFHDRHVDFVISERVLWESVEYKMSGSDYGFSMIRKDDGKTIAILTDKESEAYEQGIRDGVVITAWNGVDIDEAAANVRCVSSGGVVSNFPLQETEDIFKPIYLASMGGNKVKVRFIDESGAEKEITVTRIKEGDLKMSQAATPLAKCNHKIFVTYQEQFAYTEMLDEHCGYIYIPREFYNTLRDRPAAMVDSYPIVKELLISRIEDLRAQGMESLVIDIRGNIGGFPVICEELISLFVKEDIVMYKGIYDGKNMKKNKEYRVTADGRYADMPVVVLTNSGCGSGGDILAYYLSKCPNVTLMGITNSAHSAQAMGAECLLSDGFITVYYPMYATLDSDGSILIDPCKDRNSTVELEEKIPLDSEAVSYLYNFDVDKWMDYEAEYARKYLNKKREN